MFICIKNVTQAFEKKVKAQFSLVPFEEVTPVVEEVNLDEGDAKKTPEDGKAENGKCGEEDKEAENWGNVHDIPVTDDMEGQDDDLDKTEPFKEVESDVEKEEEKLKLKEKMEAERKRAEEKEKEEEEARKAEEIRKAEEKKQKEEKRKEELREKEEKRKQELKDKEEKRKQELKEKEEKRKQEVKEKEEKRKQEEKLREEEEQKKNALKDKKVCATKRKSNPLSGPASKVKKVDHSKADEYWKVLRSRFMVGESALTLEELIETDVIERGVLVFMLDVSKTDEFFQEYFNKFESFESAERLIVEERFSGVYLVTFEESEGADDFVELQRTLWDGTPLRKVVLPLWIVNIRFS